MQRTLAAFCLTATLAGCASTWVVDSSVKTFSSLSAMPADATYRFERLPSQQADEGRQAQLESMASAALTRVGLRRDNAKPAYGAQISARVTSTLSPWADPWLYPPGWGPGYGVGYGLGYGRGWYGGGWYGPAFPQASNPWYEREVGLVLRDVRSGQVVYETSARNDGPYSSSAVILPIMFDAALQGFPTPPSGERKVDIAVPPTPARP